MIRFQKRQPTNHIPGQVKGRSGDYYFRDCSQNSTDQLQFFRGTENNSDNDGFIEQRFLYVRTKLLTDCRANLNTA